MKRGAANKNLRCATRTAMRCSAFREPCLKYGLLARWSDALSKGSGGGFGNSQVLFAAPAADTDGAYYLAGTP